MGNGNVKSSSFRSCGLTSLPKKTKTIICCELLNECPVYLIPFIFFITDRDEIIEINDILHKIEKIGHILILYSLKRNLLLQNVAFLHDTSVAAGFVIGIRWSVRLGAEMVVYRVPPSTVSENTINMSRSSTIEM